jgi:trehalose 6-phosphate synthase
MKQRMVVISNRLPIVVSQDDHGEWQINPGSGGLVTAMTPVMKANQGVWVGWPGCDEDAPIGRLLDTFVEKEGYSLAAVPLSEEEVEKYYFGFSVTVTSIAIISRPTKR